MRRRRGARQSSNIFQMLTQQQIMELREAFNILDVNNDTIISKDDLHNFLSTIGNPFSDAEVDEMIEEFGDEISFISFITLIGEKLSALDDEKVIVGALKEFSGDLKNKELNSTDFINMKTLKNYLMTKGDKLTEEETENFLKGSVQNDLVDIKRLTMLIKHGEILVEKAEE
ncbi:Myosin regulatory light chain [Spraguea lophii 42_110]|uniref:Myosin regulatory light chain n=1 Tax=Spraguea lophii (strain 42_110) TaxID=1358809 RepID=S7XLS9_SPRLO|nr:Myosin regulatory light chain [Spraguea lophii 42_110]